MNKVAIAGASGKMGMIAVEAISQLDEFEVCAKISRTDNLKSCLINSNADILIDFTSPDSVFKNIDIGINENKKIIVGTSGLQENQIEQIRKRSQDNKLGIIIAPNFSISALLMQHITGIAEKYFRHTTIIEEHHQFKKDAPSGTAKKTASLIKGDVEIHSIRRPGVIAKQTVLMSNDNETFLVSQESLSRKSFIIGIQKACREVIKLDHLVYGLEEILLG